MGKVLHVSEVYGKSSIVKVALNHLISAQVSAFSLSLALVRENGNGQFSESQKFKSLGIDPNFFMEPLRSSMLYSKYFDMKLDRMLSGNHSNPNFSMENMYKDINLFIKEAKKQSLDTIATEGTAEFIHRNIVKGWGLDDISAMIEGAQNKSKQTS
jgi:3-hydroxyisobutyrate dehydrogenase